jgi:hypothetical protein
MNKKFYRDSKDGFVKHMEAQKYAVDYLLSMEK